MIVIAGWLMVEPPDRGAYLDGCTKVVKQARSAPGCLDFTISADLLDDARINVYERWQSEADLMSFRQSGPDDEQQVAIQDASVRRYEVASEGPA